MNNDKLRTKKVSVDNSILLENNKLRICNMLGLNPNHFTGRKSINNKLLGISLNMLDRSLDDTLITKRNDKFILEIKMPRRKKSL